MRCKIKHVTIVNFFKKEFDINFFILKTKTDPKLFSHTQFFMFRYTNNIVMRDLFQLIMFCLF